MNWKFIKTNWFYLAMAVVLLVYALRKFPHLNPLNTAAPPGKITESKKSKKSAAALLGIIPDAPSENHQEGLESANSAQTAAFLKRFAPVALSEHKKFGMPASIVLACAYANSKAGQTPAALEANNFFALTCDEGWENETAQLDGHCVRKYETAWASFRDFSIYLSSQEWFGTLKKSAGQDWEKWAAKLDKEGVSKASELRKVIEAYQLNELD